MIYLWQHLEYLTYMFLVLYKSNISFQISFTWYSIYVHVSVNNSFKFQNNETILHMVRFICIYNFFIWMIRILFKQKLVQSRVSMDCGQANLNISCLYLKKYPVSFWGRPEGPSQSRWIARPSTVVPAGLQVHPRSRANWGSAMISGEPPTQPQISHLMPRYGFVMAI